MFKRELFIHIRPFQSDILLTLSVLCVYDNVCLYLLKLSISVDSAVYLTSYTTAFSFSFFQVVLLFPLYFIENRCNCIEKYGKYSSQVRNRRLSFIIIVNNSTMLLQILADYSRCNYYCFFFFISLKLYTITRTAISLMCYSTYMLENNSM